MPAITLVSVASLHRQILKPALPHGARRLARSLSITILGQFSMLAGLFLVTRLSVHLFGPDGFGLYQIARRTLAVVAFPLMCGLGISLPRYVAREIHNTANVSRWMISALLVAAVLISSFLGISAFTWRQIGQWTFGSGASPALVWALVIAAVGMFLNTLASSALRGLSHFATAAALQVIGGAIVPLSAVLIASHSVDRALLFTGIFWILIAAAIFFRLAAHWDLSALNRSALLRGMRQLFAFGVPRVPGDLALFGLFALPAYAAVRRGCILNAGFLSVGLSLVQAIATGFASAGFVLLPYWSRAARSSDSIAVARKRTLTLVLISAVISTACLGLLQCLLPFVARLLLGPLAVAGLHDIRYVMLGAVPYVIYLVLRDYFDALTVIPLNTIALTVAILAQVALLNLHWISVPLGTAASFFVLGIFMLGLWAVSPRFLKTSF